MNPVDEVHCVTSIKMKPLWKHCVTHKNDQGFFKKQILNALEG